MRARAVFVVIAAAGGAAIAAPQDGGPKPPAPPAAKPPATGAVDLTAVHLVKGASFEFRETNKTSVAMRGKTSNTETLRTFTCTVVSHDAAKGTVLDVVFGPVSGTVLGKGDVPVRFDSAKPDLGVTDPEARQNAAQRAALAGVRARLTLDRAGELVQETGISEAMAKVAGDELGGSLKGDDAAADLARLFQPQFQKPMNVGETVKRDASGGGGPGYENVVQRSLSKADATTAVVVNTMKTERDMGGLGGMKNEYTTTTRVERATGVALLRTHVTKSTMTGGAKLGNIAVVSETTTSERVPPPAAPAPPAAPDKPK